MSWSPKPRSWSGKRSAGLVATTDPKKPELELTIDDFQPVTGWVGPKTSAKAPEHKKIVAISCATVAPFCANVTQGAVEAAKALGWDATYIDGKGSIQGFVQAFETAINMKPDGIITMAIPESQLATYIAKAHAAGIKLVGASSIPEKVSVENGNYDAYVSVREDSNTLLQAWYTIADSDGKAKVTWMWDPGISLPDDCARVDRRRSSPNARDAKSRKSAYESSKQPQIPSACRSSALASSLAIPMPTTCSPPTASTHIPSRSLQSDGAECQGRSQKRRS